MAQEEKTYGTLGELARLRFGLEVSEGDSAEQVAEMIDRALFRETESGLGFMFRSGTAQAFRLTAIVEGIDAEFSSVWMTFPVTDAAFSGAVTRLEQDVDEYMELPDA